MMKRTQRITALVLGCAMLSGMCAIPAQAAHTFETPMTEEDAARLAETAATYQLEDGVYYSTVQPYGNFIAEEYMPNPGTFDRTTLLTALAMADPEQRFAVQFAVFPAEETAAEIERLSGYGIEATAMHNSVYGDMLYAVLTAQQVEDFPASEDAGYLMGLAAKPEAAPETTPESQPAILYGDVDGSGTVELNDVVLLNRNLLGLSPLTEAQLRAADFNQDTLIDSGDSLLILRSLVHPD
ncbi:MAG: dockerin type I repeat-containing protein [Oscillospiraceae bacterium]|nr:dockerin type I repeat-containing protein [Oscillospiraceae bacterium]